MDLVQMPWNFLRGWETASSVRSFADGWNTWSTEKEQVKRKRATKKKNRCTSGVSAPKLMSLVFWYRQSCCLAGEQVKIVKQQAGCLCQRWLIPRRRVQRVGFAFQYELKSGTAAQSDELSRRKRDQQCTCPIQFALFINVNSRSSKVCLRFHEEVLAFCWNISSQCRINRFIFKIETCSGIKSEVLCFKLISWRVGYWRMK